MNASDVVIAGGIAPESATVEASDRLDALAFTHPALPGRTVVRLVAERVAEGARTELGLCGFVSNAATEGVGRVRRRALGFPARAIAEDPANARYALAVMKEFNAAKKRVATKPGHARDAFVEVAEKLGRGAPHFLPSFWEEAGRAFITHGAVAMAGTCFEKARTAEREHGLAIDEDARADAFVEFALAGALAVKSILAWPAELKKNAGPEVAYDRLFDLAVRRTLGGRAPWASLPKDLRDYAKAAKKDSAVEEARFVRAVLGAVAMRRAPLGFWQTVAKSVAPLAAEPAIGDRIARFFPELSGDDVAGWITLLEEWGILARIARDGIDGGMAAWVSRALSAWDDAPELHGVVLRMIPRLLAEGVPVPVLLEDDWSLKSVNTYEALLAAGVPLEVKDEGDWFALDDWAERDGEHCDPVLLAAHPKLGPILTRSVERELGDADFQRVAVGKKAFEKARRDHLVRTLRDAQAGALVDFEEALEQLESNVPASTRAEFPAEAAPIPELSAAPGLARSLAGAVVDEMAWPAFDAAWVELTGSQGADVTVTWMAPYAVLNDGRRAIVVGPGGREGVFDLKLPKKARNPRFRWAGGQLLVGWQDPEDWQTIQGYWSGDPKNVQEIEWPWDREASYPPRDGGVLSGRRILRPNDTSVPTGEAFSDAEGVWAVDDEGVLHAVNLANGKLGAVDRPAFLEPRDGVSPDLGESTYLTNAVGGSPLGDGPQYGWAIFDFGDVDAEAWVARNASRAAHLPAGEAKLRYAHFHVDGRAVVSGRQLEGMLRWPGHTEPVYIGKAGWRQFQLVASDGACLGYLEEESAWNRGSTHALPLPLWHHLRPRDEAASMRLRAVDVATAERLLAAAKGVDDDDDEAREAFLPALREILPIADDRLAHGVAGVVIYAAGLQARLDEWRTAAQVATVEGPKDSDVRGALEGLTTSWGRGDSSVVGTLASVKAFLDGEDVPIAETTLPWRSWLESPGALVYRTIAPATTAEERAALEPVARAFASAFTTPVRRRTIQAPRTAPWIKWVKEYGEKSVQEDFAVVEGGVRRLLHCEEDDEDQAFVTFDVLERGDGPPLAGATVVKERTVSSDDLTAWLARTLPVGDEVYAAISGPTGLSRGEAALVWAGFKGCYRWNNDPLGKEGRERMGVKLPEVKAAKELLAGRDLDKVWTVYHAALKAVDSAEALPVALATAWVAAFGARVAIDESLLAAARLDIPGGDAAVLAEIAGASGSPSYTKDGRWEVGDGGASRVEGDEDEAFDGDVLERAVGAVLWIHANTPGGHPLRKAAADAVGLLRQRLAAPGFVLEVVHSGEKPLLAWYKRFDGAAFTPTGIDPETEPEDRPTGKDRGAVLAVGEGENVHVFVRPARLTDGDVEEVTKLAAIEENWSDTGPWTALVRLRDAAFGRMLADASEGWGQDPRRSAPEIVAKARAKQGLSEEAAVAWLQLLALPNPTKSNVILWNGWKPAAYAKAVAELLAAGLVVEGKRARAGREVFLPGGWSERRSGSLPLEEWKLPLFGGETPPHGSILPLTTFAELFAAAWARVEAGKGPRYEKVK